MEHGAYKSSSCQLPQMQRPPVQKEGSVPTQLAHQALVLQGPRYFEELASYSLGAGQITCAGQKASLAENTI